MGILKVLLWILLGYYLLRLVARLLQPWIRSYASRKAEEFFRQASGDPGREPPGQSRVGEVTVEKRPSAKKREGKPVGEYIEFEEIE